MNNVNALVPEDSTSITAEQMKTLVDKLSEERGGMDTRFLANKDGWYTLDVSFFFGYMYTTVTLHSPAVVLFVYIVHDESL